MSWWMRAVIEPEPIDDSYGVPLCPLPDRLEQEPRVGDPCPKCRVGRLDYDGLLNLTCQECGYAVQGCFT